MIKSQLIWAGSCGKPAVVLSLNASPRIMLVSPVGLADRQLQDRP